MTTHNLTLVDTCDETLLDIQPRTEFGQTIMENDHGHDDLNHLRSDIPLADVLDMQARVDFQVQELMDLPVIGKTLTLVADIDVDGPAKVVKPITTVPGHSYTRMLREPDFYDDGWAVWIGPKAAVSVPVDVVPQFRSWMHVHGMGIGVEPVHLIHPFNGAVTDKWDTLVTTCRIPRAVS